MFGILTDCKSRFAQGSNAVSCATKKPIADAHRAAGAARQETSLGQILEKHCFSVLLSDGASIAAEVGE